MKEIELFDCEMDEVDIKILEAITCLRTAFKKRHPQVEEEALDAFIMSIVDKE